MTDDINQIPSTSPNLRTELARQLEALVPEAIADGKVDVIKLKELLDDDVRDDTERFGLFWPGKKRALRAAQEPTTATLRPMKDQSKDWDTTQNVFIEGDNLEVLKILQKRYHNSVDVIYIDPPYNTGNDFIYPDNYQEGLQSYLEFTKQVDEGGRRLSSNAETEGRYHSKWLNMMYPRLKLARNLLSDSGIIFVSIGDQELDNLRRVMCEIFGEGNALPILTRVTKRSSNNGTTFSPCTDYVLAFARRIESVRPFSVPLTAEQINSYNKTDERGRFKEIGLYQAALKHGGSRYPIEAPDGQQLITPGTAPWRWSATRYAEQLAAGNVVFKQTKQSPLVDAETGQRGRWNIYTKLHLEDREEAGLLPKSFVEEFQNSIGARDLAALEIPFDFPKPVAFVKFLLSITGNAKALVLDFFAGSATTAHATMALNAEDGGSRRYIMVQLPEPVAEGSEAARSGIGDIADLARRRISGAGAALVGSDTGTLFEGQQGLDTGFRSYALADTRFSKWRVSSDINSEELQQQLLAMRDSSDDEADLEDLLTEILLKQGFSLSESCETLAIDGLDFISVGDGSLTAYLTEHEKPSLEQLRAALDLGPARFIILEDAFHGDDELKTNLKQICKTKQIELWTA